MSGALSKSTEVMKYMQQLCKVSEVQATMMEMSKEMMKAGIIEEMLEDTFESMEDDDLEEASSEEVEKILFEITASEFVLHFKFNLFCGISFHTNTCKPGSYSLRI